MKNVTKLAKKSAGLSQKCSICPLMQRCTLEIHRDCFDSFVEGFKKGARAAEKGINKMCTLKKWRIDYESKPNIFSCDIHHISIIHRSFPTDILTVQCILSLLA